MVEEENLTVDNVIEVYYASVHFNLMELRLYIMDRLLLLTRFFLFAMRI